MIRLSMTVFFVISLCARVFGSDINEALRSAEKFEHEKSLDILLSIQGDERSAQLAAWGYLNIGKISESIKEFKKIRRKDYTDWLGLGIAHYLDGNYRESYKSLEKSLAQNANCAAAVLMQAMARINEAKSSEAVELCKKALKLDYNITEARELMADLYYSLGDYNNAYKEWHRLGNVDTRYQKPKTLLKELASLITESTDAIIQPSRITDSNVLNYPASRDDIPKLRVMLLKDMDRLKIASKGGLIVKAGGKAVKTVKENEEFILLNSDKNLSSNAKIYIEPAGEKFGIIIRDVQYARGFAWAGIADREYRGVLEITLASNKMKVINIVNTEEYLYSVIPSEMISWWPEEALKAQAVLARTQAFYRKNVARMHRKDGFDLCSSQHCQVYSGIKQEVPRTTRATDETRGEVAQYKGRYMHTLFSSNCSGHTQSCNELKGWGHEPFLIGSVDGQEAFPDSPYEFRRWLQFEPDIYCAPSKNTYYAESRWIRIVKQSDIAERMGRTKNIGRIKKIVPLKRSISGHINHLLIQGENGSIEIQREHIIRSILLGRIRSTNFLAEPAGLDGDGYPQLFVFWGGGWGHAVGFCQSGAAGMAEKGFNYRQIMEKYYKDIEIKNLNY